MIMKFEEKEQAIAYRCQGLSYNDILQRVPVAKSTLSLWLRSVGLAKRQRQVLTERKRLGQQKGGRVRHEQRLRITEAIRKVAVADIGAISQRELWLIGSALYWAEGAKQKAHRVSAGVIFSNSDPWMIKLFIIWLRQCCGVPAADMSFTICLHESSADRLEEVRRHWSRAVGLPLDRFGRTSWKKNKLNTKRKNIGKDYFGLLRIVIARSANFNRQITGWVEGICKNCGVV